jgi:hypothetical protein
MRPYIRDGRPRKQQIGLLRREDREAFLLGGEEVPDVGAAASGDPLGRPLRGDEVDLAGERADALVLDRAARQVGAGQQRDDDRDRDRGGDPDEEAPAQRRRPWGPDQGPTAL